jgi:hypothetical protein
MKNAKVKLQEKRVGSVNKEKNGGNVSPSDIHKHFELFFRLTVVENYFSVTLSPWEAITSSRT